MCERINQYLLRERSNEKILKEMLIVNDQCFKFGNKIVTFGVTENDSISDWSQYQLYSFIEWVYRKQEKTGKVG